MSKLLPFGAWPSPITAESVAAAAIALSEPRLEDGMAYWLERRPDEGGRSVIVRAGNDDRPDTLTPAGFNVRSRVNEYGGGAYTVSRGVLFFSHDGDGRLYRQAPGEAPQPISPEDPRARYADLTFDHRRERLIAVREYQPEDDRPGREPRHDIVAINRRGSVQVLATGADFYAGPRLSPDCRRLLWLCWRHPNMPWDGTQLLVADLDADGQPETTQVIAGGEDESIFQPDFGPADSRFADGVLFVSDRSRWWNLYYWDGSAVTALHPRNAEYGLPQWVFGMRSYAAAGGDTLAALSIRDGIGSLSKLSTDTQSEQCLATGYTAFHGIDGADGVALVVASAVDKPNAVLRVELQSGDARTLRSAGVAPDPAYLSTPQPVAFPTTGGATAHALFDPPAHADCVGPEGDKPPVLVKSHGGPTTQVHADFNLGIQFWTSRGFAVLDVNYSGSSGYGRDYRERLHGQWGVMDVDDCVNALLWADAQGLVDKRKAAIRGSSAGGYTTLAALAFRDIFKAGACYYGISDLQTLLNDTHKFESRYLDRLIGPYPACDALYAQRSPIHAVDALSAPVIFFQGSEDRIVPPNQAERMAAALRAKGITVAYHRYPGEAHGFRQAANIAHALRAEWAFYANAFGFNTPDNAPPTDPQSTQRR